MDNVLSWLINTTVGRWVGVISIGALIFGGVIWLQVHDAKVREAERKAQADKFSQALEQTRKEARAQADEQIAEAKKDREDAIAEKQEAQRRMDAHAANDVQITRTLAAIASEKQRLSSEVAKLSDSDRRPYIIQHLGLRKPEDKSACYTPSEEAAIADAITQYPACQSEIIETQKRVIELQGAALAAKDKQTATEKEVASVQKELGAVTLYTTRLESLYTQLYNLFPRKRRSIKCLGLWKCGNAKPLDVPDPLTLKQGAPK